MLRLRTAFYLILWPLIVLAGPGLRAELVSRQQGLQATLQEAVTAFEQADYARAAEGFAHIETTYADEPAYHELEQSLLPVWAHACRLTGDNVRAAELYEIFLECYPNDDAQAPFVLFGLAQASQALGENARAAAAYQSYRARFPDRPEALLSVLHEADLAFAEGTPDKGIDELLAFAADPRVPPTLRSQARLRAVQAAQSHGEDARAANILLGDPWAVTTMPELAILAFASLRAGDFLAREGRTADTILAYRNVPPHHILVDLQRERLAQLEQIKRERTQANPEGIQIAAFWEEYFGGIIDKVRAELDELVVMEDYTPAWQMRLGEAFLRDDRSREAGLLFGELAANTALPGTLRAPAHYRWILCAQAREDWPLALERAHAFLANYPDDPLAPATLTLIAEALLQSGRYSEAIDALTRLIETYPDASRQPQWRFRRGYAYALAQDYPEAREDFVSIVNAYPSDPLAPRARLWLGLSYFFEYNYADALVQFDTLLPDVTGTPLEAETDYRRAATLYSMRNYTEAQQALEAFLKNHPENKNAPAARVLLGDTLMGLGELDTATEQFACVGPEAGALYPYAVFQTGKIYRVSEKYDTLIAHFTAYAEETNTPTRPRLAEALYWVGWAHARQGDPAAGFPQFMEALTRTGNDPQSGDTGPLLQALETLYARAQAGDIALSADDPASAELLAADSFEGWLETQQAAALEKNELTRTSRYGLALSKLYRQRGRDDRADAILYDMMVQVPPERLDSEALITLGDTLAAANAPTAAEYYLYHLEHFSQNPRTGAALYGMARLAATSGDKDSADQWLRRFEAETPYHAAAPLAALLHARVLTDMKQYAEAESVLENQLQSPAFRGRPQAEALLLMAAIAANQGNPQRAIACDQRVYTVYRAWPDLLAQAYWHSTQMFQQLGDDPAALRTLVEMTDDPRLADTPEYAPALALRAELEAKLPPMSASDTEAVKTPTTMDTTTSDEEVAR
ncbi:MAG: tetratricopeptide repeat protein [Verrucomicrobiota bacterium JB024]|nr:tetratricopeptide repeat protein [Verrucomicrobiota bacterium JB024]